jgi:rod shape-determining protein MreD
MALDVLKIGLLLFGAALLQTSIVGSIAIGGGTPDLLLVTLVGIALLRGSSAGAAAGFVGGLLLDTANLQTLGFTSLILTVAGYWIGRYGETTGRDRAHAPFASVAVVTVLYAFASLGLHFILGESAPARFVLLEALLPTVLLNLLLTWPVYALCGRLLPPVEWAGRTREVRLLG